MKAKKSLFATGAVTALTLGALTMLHASPAYAASNSANLIERLTERFGLSRDEVQTVFDEYHADFTAQHEQAMQDRLSQAVADGKITQAQADLITAKHEELKSFLESLKDKAPLERREALKTKMDELRKWAEDNDIPLQYLHGGMKGPYGKFGHRMGMSFMHSGK